MPEKEIDSEDEAEFEQDIEMEEVEWNEIRFWRILL